MKVVLGQTLHRDCLVGRLDPLGESWERAALVSSRSTDLTATTEWGIGRLPTSFVGLFEPWEARTHRQLVGPARAQLAKG